MNFQPAEFPRLIPELETTLFRVIQEALTNVFRHSQATKASVTLEKKENQIALTIRDDGVGVADEISKFRPGSIWRGDWRHAPADQGNRRKICPAQR